MTYEGLILREDYQDLIADNRKAIQLVLDTRELVEKAGLEVETVSVGGTHNYEIVGAMSGVTEVRVDTYPLMDYNYCHYRSQFKPAAKVLATVISHPNAGSAIVDAGHKAIGHDLGLPVVEAFSPDISEQVSGQRGLQEGQIVAQGKKGGRIGRLSAEHCVLELEGEAQFHLDVGAKVWLIPWDLGLCVNQYNYFHAMRDGMLGTVWEIAARGRFD